MKFINTILLLVILSLFTASCAAKYGCPSNGKNVGAERLSSGEKLPKVKKMRV